MRCCCDRFVPDEEVKILLFGGGFRCPALQDGHTERRDANRLSVLRADGRYGCRGLAEIVPDGRVGVCLPADGRRGCRGDRTDVRRGFARPFPPELRRGASPLLVGGDVQPHYGGSTGWWPGNRPVRSARLSNNLRKTLSGCSRQGFFFFIYSGSPGYFLILGNSSPYPFLRSSILR